MEMPVRRSVDPVYSMCVQPAFIIGTDNEDGSANFAPITWVSVTHEAGDGYLMVISMSGTKRTKQNVERAGIFSANLVSTDMLPLMDYLGTRHAKDGKKDGMAYDLSNAHGNNMQAPYSKDRAAVMKTGSIVIPEHKPGSYLAVAIEGVHGAEGVYCASEISGQNIGFPRRAPDYKANVWEHRVMDGDRNNTFFMPLPEGSEGKTVTIKALFADKKCADITCNVWLCEEHNQK